MHGFLIKGRKEQKSWMKLIRDLRWLAEIFSVLASVENLVLTLSYFLAFFFYEWSVNNAFFGHVRKRGK